MSESSGWLYKLGGGKGGRHNWNRRWFANSVSDPFTLNYYSNEKATQLKGSVDLRQISCFRINNPEMDKVSKSVTGPQIGFELTLTDRVFKMVATDEKDSRPQQYWLDNFNALIMSVERERANTMKPVVRRSVTLGSARRTPSLSVVNSDSSLGTTATMTSASISESSPSFTSPKAPPLRSLTDESPAPYSLPSTASASSADAQQQQASLTASQKPHKVSSMSLRFLFNKVTGAGSSSSSDLEISSPLSTPAIPSSSSSSIPSFDEPSSPLDLPNVPWIPDKGFDVLFIPPSHQKLFLAASSPISFKNRMFGADLSSEVCHKCLEDISDFFPPHYESPPLLQAMQTAKLPNAEQVHHLCFERASRSDPELRVKCGLTVEEAAA